METATINSTNQFLSFSEQKVQPITLSQLERTHKENDVYGKPLKGIYHFDLMHQIIGMCHEAGYNADVWDLFAAQNNDRNSPGAVVLPQVEQVYGERAIEAHILRRVYANIRLTDFDDETYTTNLAVAFHQKGIQVGFGNMVKICHNQCMLSPDSYISTYSDKGKGRGEGVEVPQLLETVRGWLLGDVNKRIIRERQAIERMKEYIMAPDEMFRIIGLLTTIRVKCDTSNKEIRENKSYPLSQTQINALTEAMIITAHTNGFITLWDLYNGATELYKATGMDIPNMLPQNKALVELLNEEYPDVEIL